MKTKSQSGRSMVEMLGVLAIIGVLSVGGIAGYSLSMRRHRANQIIDLMSKYALTGYSQCQKDLLDGTIEKIENCNFIYFEESGIGNYPTGVMSHYSWISTDTTTQVDTIIVNMGFEDLKLCQTIASIAGTTCTAYSTNWGGTSIRFKQN